MDSNRDQQVFDNKPGGGDLIPGGAVKGHEDPNIASELLKRLGQGASYIRQTARFSKR
jgi:hypothetical protein